MLALIALIAVAMKSATSPSMPQQAPNSKRVGPSQMWVDRAVNTALRNDAQGDDPMAIDRYIRSTYAAEAATHPGVRLVAGKAHV
jgi:hypothetical protein